MKDLFGEESDNYRTYTIFQDESWCKKSNFFYHGFLFVRNNQGRRILNKIIEIKKDNNRRESNLSFKIIRGAAANSEEGKKAKIARLWLELADRELQRRNIKFYLLGVNKNNIKNFWRTGKFDESIYLRFFEIGLKSSMRWFGEDKKEARPLRISHLYYEYGNYNDGREKKIKWLSYDFFKRGLSWILPQEENVSALYSDEKISKSELSNLVQFADIILGTGRCAFISIPKSHQGRQECVDDFIEIIERFNDGGKAYNISSKYFKNFCINFFPTKSDLSKEEFLGKSWAYAKKAGGFYCDRETHSQLIARQAQRTLDL